jgi:hypothetical protein
MYRLVQSIINRIGVISNIYIFFFAVPVSYSTAHPMEDADSRTLYVNNVGIYMFSSPLYYFVPLDYFIYLYQIIRRFTLLPPRTHYLAISTSLVQC